jgi:hypothetical protein
MPAAGAVAIAIFVAAFWAASWERCEGQIEFYFLFGLGALLVLFVLPIAVKSASSLAVRIGCAFGFALLGTGIWIGGLAAANVRLLCRLF